MRLTLPERRGLAKEVGGWGIGFATSSMAESAALTDTSVLFVLGTWPNHVFQLPLQFSDCPHK